MFYDSLSLINLILIAVYFLMHHFMSKINKSNYIHAKLFINMYICITFFHYCTENGRRWFERPNKSHTVRKHLQIILQVTKKYWFHSLWTERCVKMRHFTTIRRVSFASFHFFHSADVLYCHPDTNFASSNFNTYKLSEVFPVHTMMAYGGMEIQLHPFCTTDEWSALGPGCLTSRGTCPLYPLNIWLGEPQISVDFRRD